MPWQDMTQSCLCSGVKEYGKKGAYIFSFQNSLSECEELQTWICSKSVLSFLMQFEGHF